MAEPSTSVIVHPAVRRDLARTEAALRDFPPGDRGRARQLQRAWRSLSAQLHRHRTREYTYVWPYLRRQRALDLELLDTMEAEHVAMSDAMGEATVAVDALAARPSAARADRAAERVAEAARVTEAHLAHEEADVVPAIVDRVDTPEWKAVERQLRKGSMVRAGRMVAWLEDGADPQVLDALRSTVPSPVRFVLGRAIGRSYRREVIPTRR